MAPQVRRKVSQIEGRVEDGGNPCDMEDVINAILFSKHFRKSVCAGLFI